MAEGNTRQKGGIGLAGRLLKRLPGGVYVYKTLISLRRLGLRSTVYKIKGFLTGYLRMYGYANHPAQELRRQRETVFPKAVRFSIVVPLYNTPIRFLKEMISSAQGQTYANWELCLADGSDAKHNEVGEFCKAAALKDKRILYKKLEKNGGISENTNCALELATGEYIGMLDHDDVLDVTVLYEAMRAVCEKNADFIYTDEATFTKRITRAFNPHFKPDFAPDNLRANNYICHFMAFERALLNLVGPFRSQCDGSQDFDMALRLTEAASSIVHIPKVLYYWRAHGRSVAQDLSNKPYVIAAAQRAVADHLARVGLQGEVVNSSVLSTYKINYAIKGPPLVSILIPNKDHAEDLKKCLNSVLEKTTYPRYEVLVIENNSAEKATFDYYAQLEARGAARVVRYEGGFNYSAVNNFGARHANGEYLLLLNNDVDVITPGWIEEMLMYAQRQDVGAVGAKLYYPDDTVQHGGVYLIPGGVVGHMHQKYPRNSNGYMFRLTYAQDVTAVTAACMMIKKPLYKELGGLDEAFAVAYNDVDFCLHLRKVGYLNVFTPYAELYHYGGKCYGLHNTTDTVPKEIRFFQERWKDELARGDPYVNPCIFPD